VLLFVTISLISFSNNFSISIVDYDEEKDLVNIKLSCNFIPVERPSVIVFYGDFQKHISLLKRTNRDYNFFISLKDKPETFFSIFVKGKDLVGSNKVDTFMNFFSTYDFIPKIKFLVVSTIEENGINYHVSYNANAELSYYSLNFDGEKLNSIEELKDKFFKCNEGFHKVHIEFKNKFGFISSIDSKVLKIKEYVFSEKILKPVAKEEKMGFHIVKKGESIYKIADEYKINPGEIVKLNSIKDPSKIYVGQPLIIGKVKYFESPVQLKINMSKNLMKLYYGNTLLKVYPVAVGRSDSTPPGYYKIMYQEKEPALYWYGEYIKPGSIINGIGSRWLQLSEKQYGIHGTTKPWEIGKRISHGCIRMLNKDVEEVEFLCDLGTEVYVEKGEE